MKKRQGFSLALVLIIMLVVIFLSAVIMDLTTNYFSTSQATIEHQKLYNAAQSGVEEAKAWLLDSRGAISKDLVENVVDWEDVLVRSHDFEDGNGISVETFVLNCNYVPDTDSSPDISGLPPIYHEYFPPGTSSQITGEGQSGFIDPNRNILGLRRTGGRVFVLRSIARTENNKRTGIESMVVIPND
ncbi:MAG: hypothetical protein JW971_04900 [Synergistales bacterium]|nr:hypothetical protein [Synergistales bacterium]